MARTWQELFDTGDDASVARPEPAQESERRGFFRRLRDNMAKTRQALGAELQATVFQSLDDEAFERLEETLIYADVGAPTTAKIVERLETEVETGDLQGGEDLSRRLRELLADTARVNGDTIPLTETPTVIFDAIEAARGRGRDVVICDTAGRLHTQQHLMDELRKVREVISGQVSGAPHETLLTIDATTGQNGLRQALLFGEAVDVTGIALTKLDGTAKGGIALAIAQELGVPVKLIGIGEALEDLRPFDPDDFAQAILEP